MKTRKVLSIVHGKFKFDFSLSLCKYLQFSVFEIILRISEGKSWEETLLQVLPERKNAQPISHCSSPIIEEEIKQL